MTNVVNREIGFGSKQCGHNYNGSCAHSGFRPLSYFDLFFNRIHILPPSGQLGLVPRQGVVFDFELLNTFDIEIDVIQVVAESGEGISLSVAPGDTLPPGQSRVFQAVVTSEGQEEFESIFTFNFSNDADPVTLTLSGTREPSNEIWPFRWNWNSSVTTFDRFKTDIITAYTGREQRISLKEFADKLFAANYLVNRIDMEKALNLSAGWAHKKFSSPLWHRRSAVSENAPAGQSFLILEDASKLRADRGQGLYIVRNGQFYSSQVLSVDGNQIQLNSPLFEDVYEGDEVVVAVITRFQEQPRFNHITDTTSSISATFIEDESLNVEPALPSFSGDYLDGYPVFPFEEDMNQSQGSQYVLERDGFVGDGGFEEIVYRGNSPYVTAERSFTLDRDKPWEFLSFFNDVIGRQGAFWFEMFFAGLTLKDDIQPDSSLLRFEDNKFFDLLKDSSAYQKVVLTLVSGEKVVLGVNGVDRLDGVSFLRVTPPGRELSRVNVERVSFMMLARFASDDLRMTWLTDGLATVSTTIKTLTDEEFN